MTKRSSLQLAGPMYAGPLQNPAFAARILSYLTALDPSVYATLPRIEGMLATAAEETLFDRPLPDAFTPFLSALQKTPPPQPPSATTTTSLPPTIPPLPPHLPDPHPFLLSPPALSAVLRCPSPPFAALRGALIRLGHRCTRSHTLAVGLKTDAPWRAVWRVMRAWARRQDEWRGAEGLGAETAGRGILRRGVETGAAEGEEEEEGADADVVFDEAVGRLRDAGGRRLVRYQVNPRPNWGPMSRAK